MVRSPPPLIIKTNRSLFYPSQKKMRTESWLAGKLCLFSRFFSNFNSFFVSIHRINTEFTSGDNPLLAVCCSIATLSVCCAVKTVRPLGASWSCQMSSVAEWPYEYKWKKKRRAGYTLLGRVSQQLLTSQGQKREESTSEWEGGRGKRRRAK